MAFTWPGGNRTEPLDIETIPEKVERIIDQIRDKKDDDEDRG